MTLMKSEYSSKEDTDSNYSHNKIKILPPDYNHIRRISFVKVDVPNQRVLANSQNKVICKFTKKT
jgi:hypothetical protein